jgi:hypothetical protein
LGFACTAGGSGQDALALNDGISDLALIGGFMASLRTNTGRRLNELWAVKAKHALYHKDGLWYERLEQFPGALFDANGYVLFETEEAFAHCPDLRITQKVWVPKGVASILTYRRMRSLNSAADSIGSQAIGVADAFEEGGVKFQLHRLKERNRRAVRRKKEIVLSRHGKLACEACGYDFAQVYGPLGAEFASATT